MDKTLHATSRAPATSSPSSPVKLSGASPVSSLFQMHLNEELDKEQQILDLLITLLSLRDQAEHSSEIYEACCGTFC